MRVTLFVTPCPEKNVSAHRKNSAMSAVASSWEVNRVMAMTAAERLNLKEIPKSDPVVCSQKPRLSFLSLNEKEKKQGCCEKNGIKIQKGAKLCSLGPVSWDFCKAKKSQKKARQGKLNISWKNERLLSLGICMSLREQSLVQYAHLPLHPAANIDPKWNGFLQRTIETAGQNEFSFNRSAPTTPTTKHVFSSWGFKAMFKVARWRFPFCLFSF